MARFRSRVSKKKRGIEGGRGFDVLVVQFLQMAGGRAVRRKRNESEAAPIVREIGGRHEHHARTPAGGQRLGRRRAAVRAQAADIERRDTRPREGPLEERQLNFEGMIADPRIGGQREPAERGIDGDLAERRGDAVHVRRRYAIEAPVVRESEYHDALRIQAFKRAIHGRGDGRRNTPARHAGPQNRGRRGTGRDAAAAILRSAAGAGPPIRQCAPDTRSHCTKKFHGLPL